MTYVEKEYWYPFLTGEGEYEDREKLEKIEGKGLTKFSPTVPLLLYWLRKGICFSLTRLLKWTFSGISYIVRRFLSFAWVLIKMIHSRGRVMSAFYAGIGILISCLAFGRVAENTFQIIIVIVSGGVIGAAASTLGLRIIESFPSQTKCQM